MTEVKTDYSSPLLSCGQVESIFNKIRTKVYIDAVIAL